MLTNITKLCICTVLIANQAWLYVYGSTSTETDEPLKGKVDQSTRLAHYNRGCVGGFAFARNGVVRWLQCTT